MSITNLQNDLQKVLQSLLGSRPVKVLVFPDNGIKVLLLEDDVFMWEDLDQQTAMEKIRTGTHWFEVVGWPKINAKGNTMVEVRKGSGSAWIDTQWFTQVNR